DVEQHTHPWPERVDVVELETGNLQHHDRLWRDVRREARERVSDVSANDRLKSCRSEDVAEQRRGGRLSVRAGDRDDRRAAEPGGRFDFRVDRDAAALDVSYYRGRIGNARADDHEIGLDGAIAVSHRLERDAGVRELGGE